MTEAARSFQGCLHADSTFQEGELSEELCTHLCSVQSFFCFVFLAQANVQVLQWFSHACGVGVTCLHFMGGGAHTSRPHAHAHKHTSMHTHATHTHILACTHIHMHMCTCACTCNLYTHATLACTCYTHTLMHLSLCVLFVALCLSILNVSL